MVCNKPVTSTSLVLLGHPSGPGPVMELELRTDIDSMKQLLQFLTGLQSFY